MKDRLFEFSYLENEWRDLENVKLLLVVPLVGTSRVGWSAGGAVAESLDGA